MQQEYSEFVKLISWSENGIYSKGILNDKIVGAIITVKNTWLHHEGDI